MYGLGFKSCEVTVMRRTWRAAWGDIRSAWVYLRLNSLRCDQGCARCFGSGCSESEELEGSTDGKHKSRINNTSTNMILGLNSRSPTWGGCLMRVKLILLDCESYSWACIQSWFFERKKKNSVPHHAWYQGRRVPLMVNLAGCFRVWSQVQGHAIQHVQHGINEYALTTRAQVRSRRLNTALSVSISLHHTPDAPLRRNRKERRGIPRGIEPCTVTASCVSLQILASSVSWISHHHWNSLVCMYNSEDAGLSRPIREGVLWPITQSLLVLALKHCLKLRSQAITQLWHPEKSAYLALRPQLPRMSESEAQPGFWTGLVCFCTLDRFLWRYEPTETLIIQLWLSAF